MRENDIGLSEFGIQLPIAENIEQQVPLNIVESSGVPEEKSMQPNSPTIEERINRRNLLQERLNQYILENPREYDEQTIRKMREFLFFVGFQKKLPWQKYFDSIEDFRLFYTLNVEWHDLSIKSMQNDTTNGGGSFYQKLSAFTNSYVNPETGNVDSELGAKLRESLIPSTRTDWGSFGDDDFRRIWQEHPEWHGLNSEQLQSKKFPGGATFYKWLRRYIKKYKDPDTGQNDAKKAEVFYREFFPDKRTNWALVQSYEDFKQIWQEHPEWHGLTTSQTATKNSPSGSNTFYEKLKQFTESFIDPSTGQVDPIKGQEIFQEFFPSQVFDWSHINSIEELRKVWQEHPEWHGLSTDEIKTISGGDSIYRKIRQLTQEYTNPLTGDVDVEKGQIIFEEFFPKLRKNNWTELNKIEDFLEIWQEHPEWHGLSTSEIQNDIFREGKNFYAQLVKFTNSYVNPDTGEADVNLGLKLRQEFFPPRGKRRSYEFENGSKIVFDSSPERIVGILLHTYGLLESPIEGTNVHVKINMHKKNSLDFLVNNVFIEYHPTQQGDSKNGVTQADLADYRLGHITNPNFTNIPIYHIWEITQLYDILDDPLINRNLKEGEHIDEEEFKEQVIKAYQMAGKYDENHDSINKPLATL